VCLVGLLAGAAAGCGVRSPKPPARVVVAVIDTLRADHLPAYGYPRDTAPFLSRLAREGVVFEHAYSPSSWTAPATASLFTSLYPVQHGVLLGLRTTRKLQARDTRVRLRTLPEPLEVLPEAMKRAGYATFGLTANVNVSEQMGFAQGFDRFRNLPTDDTAEVLHARLMAWRERLAAPPRAFLYLHYLDPHSPYRERGPWFDESSTGVERVLSAYDSEIRNVDEHLRQAYEALAWDRDTLLVVTADHGEEFWEHGSVEHGRTVFGEVLNVPLLVRFPGGRWGGRRVSAPVSLVDVLPTLRECVGLPPEAEPHAAGAGRARRGRAHAVRAPSPARPRFRAALRVARRAPRRPQAGAGRRGRPRALRPSLGPSRHPEPGRPRGARGGRPVAAPRRLRALRATLRRRRARARARRRGGRGPARARLRPLSAGGPRHSAGSRSALRTPVWSAARGAARCAKPDP
jgi:arylsulfatase A-like enzyme